MLQWRPETIGRQTVAVAALGVIAPLWAGRALGQPATGFTIGLGAMLLGGGGMAAGGRPEARSALLPAMLAAVSTSARARHDWSDVAMILLATAAAVISGYSRPVSVAAIRFNIYFVLTLNLLASASAYVTLCAHWRRTMRQPAGWQFPLRLAGALIVANVIEMERPANLTAGLS